MPDIAQGMRFKIDLDAGLVQKPQREILMQNDKNANKVIVEVTRKGYMEQVSLDGVGVTGEFIRPSGTIVPLTGSAVGNVATVLLNEHCYTESGHFELTVKLTQGSTQRTLLYISGNVARDADGPLVDVEEIIPSIDDIIAMLSEMRQATEAAQRATQNANKAANDAKVALNGVNDAKNAANTAAEKANAAASGANTAKDAANAAAGKINNMTVSATGLAEGKAPTAAISETGGHKHITFGIPQGKTGQTGATPKLSIGTVKTGLPGTDAAATLTGTAENPVLNLTIPEGQRGKVDGVPLSDVPAKNLAAVASAGTSNEVARADHKHKNSDRIMPIEVITGKIYIRIPNLLSQGNEDERIELQYHGYTDPDGTPNDSNFKTITLLKNNGFFIHDSFSKQNIKVYTDANKPTPDEISAVAFTAQMLTDAQKDKARNNIGAYGATNPPPYPVTSVNGQTGDVVVKTSSGGAQVSNAVPKPLAATAAAGTSVEASRADHEHPYPPYIVGNKSSSLGVNLTASGTNEERVDIQIKGYTDDSGTTNPAHYKAFSVAKSGRLSVWDSVSNASFRLYTTNDKPTSTEISAVSFLTQTLTDAQKTQARKNIGAGASNVQLSNAEPKALAATASAGTSAEAARSDHIHPKPSIMDIGAVAFTMQQSLTDEQKQQARTNIGAAAAGETAGSKIEYIYDSGSKIVTVGETVVNLLKNPKGAKYLILWFTSTRPPCIINAPTNYESIFGNMIPYAHFGSNGSGSETQPCAFRSFTVSFKDDTLTFTDCVDTWYLPQLKSWDVEAQTKINIYKLLAVY